LSKTQYAQKCFRFYFLKAIYFWCPVIVSKRLIISNLPEQCFASDEVSKINSKNIERKILEEQESCQHRHPLAKVFAHWKNVYMYVVEQNNSILRGLLVMKTDG
jgi:hypothetical protein